MMISCEKSDEQIDISNECVFHDNILSTCFYGTIGSEYDEIVFRDNESFQKFGNNVRIYPINSNCNTAKLPTIDFSRYSLLSKRIYGSGCSATYQRRVLKDTENKMIIYEIAVEYKGACDMLLGSRNWAIIPVVSDNYMVEFRLK